MLGRIRVVTELADAGFTDILIVNDGSDPDRLVWFEKAAALPGCTVLTHTVNRGKGRALKTAFEYLLAHRPHSRGAVTIDGDGQHRPEFIADMKKKMEEGYDIVIGSRFVHEKKPKSMRMLGSNLIEFAIRLTTGKVIKDPTSGMRLFNRKMIREFAKGLNFGPEPDTISYLLKQGASVAEVPVVMDERTKGVSYLTPVNAARYMIQMLVSILFIQNFRK